MKLAIVHFHFNRGGVTQVVLNHLRGLNATVRAGGARLQVALIYGGRREGIADEQLSGFSSLDVSLHTLPSLDYDNDTAPDAATLAQELRDRLASLNFAPGETLLHVHNHSLGKNVSLPGAIHRLAADGFHFLLQMHDFAEDLRPANYRRLSEALADGGDPAPVLYAEAPQIHYAVLNGRDYGILRSAQLADARLHPLPNAVAEFGTLPPKVAAREKLQAKFDVPPEARYVVYPVRGIRRKNVGEMLLWSALADGAAVFAITLPPLNPVEQQSYDRWKKLAGELNLSCVFDTGAPGGLDFPENLAAADALITTSIAEGFGMVFLEAWLAGRPLWGRDLPEITADFVNAGINFPNLSPQMLVPIDCAGRDALEDSLATAYTQLLRQYGRTPLSEEQVAAQVRGLLESETVDFARLSSTLQAQVLRSVRQDASLREEILQLNPTLRQALTGEANERTISQNAECVRQTYSLAGSGRRLRKLYDASLRSPAAKTLTSPPAAEQILEAFLDIRRLHPIRFEE